MTFRIGPIAIENPSLVKDSVKKMRLLRFNGLLDLNKMTLTMLMVCTVQSFVHWGEEALRTNRQIDRQTGTLPSV